VSHDDWTIATVAAVCAALSLAPAVWAWWTVRGNRPAVVGAGLGRRTVTIVDVNCSPEASDCL